MPIDASIYGNLRPAPVASPLESMQRVMTLKDLALQNQMRQQAIQENALKLQMQKQAQADQSTIMQAMSADPKNWLESVKGRVSPQTYMTLQKNDAETREALAKKSKEELALDTEKNNRFIGLIDQAGSLPPELYQQAWPNIAAAAKQIHPDIQIDPTTPYPQQNLAALKVGLITQDQYLKEAKEARDRQEAEQKKAEAASKLQTEAVTRQNIQSEINARENPKPTGDYAEFKNSYLPGWYEKNGKPKSAANEMQAYQEWVAGKREPKNPTDVTLALDASKGDPRKAFDLLKGLKQTSEGTWTLEEGPDGKPVLLNSKTGQTKPAVGVQKTGTFAKAQKEKEPTVDALNYAMKIESKPNPTASDDVALMDQFFQASKPKRMNKAQTDMLENGKNIIEKGKSSFMRNFNPEAPYFTPTQRKQIIQTIKDLAESQGVKPEASGDRPSLDSIFR